MPNGYSYFLPDGTPVSGSADAPLPGTPFYQSEQLTPDATATTAGDAFNAFKGYVSPDGGTFGGGPSADVVAARRAWESLSGVSGDKLGDTSGWDAGKWDTMRRTFGGIANKDKGTTLEALRSDNPFLKETANRYATDQGWIENAIPYPKKVTPVPTDPFAPFADPMVPPTETAMPPETAIPLPGRVHPVNIDPNSPAAPLAPQSQWSGGSMAPSAGSAGRPSMQGGRFGRFAPMSGAGGFAQKFRQRFKPLGAPANGFTPGSGSGGAVGGGGPSSQVF